MRWLYGPPFLRRLQIAAAIVLLALIVLSLITPLAWTGRVHNGMQLAIELRSTTFSIDRRRLEHWGTTPRAPGWSTAALSPSPRWSPRAWMSPGGGMGVDLPLWLPLALILLPSLAARAILRRSQPGHCVHCGYDLRPIPAAPSFNCPECGQRNHRRRIPSPPSPTEALPLRSPRAGPQNPRTAGPVREAGAGPETHRPPRSTPPVSPR